MAAAIRSWGGIALFLGGVAFAKGEPSFVFNSDTHRCKDSSGADYTLQKLGMCYVGSIVPFLPILKNRLELEKVDLSRSQIQFYDFSSFHLRQSGLKTGLFHHLRLDDVRIEDSDLRGTFFTSLKVSNFSITRSKLEGILINQSSFTGGDFKGSVFTDAVLTDVQFRDCLLPKKMKTQAILINVTFENCQFIDD